MNYIYFIQQISEDSYIKIGTSINPEKRIRHIEQHSPYKIKTLAIVDSSKIPSESHLHKQFGAFRIKGEWYSPTKELLDYISSLSIKSTKTVNESIQYIESIDERMYALILDIKKEKDNARIDDNYCANSVWFSKYDNRLNSIVGWFADNPLLRSENSDLYNNAFTYLYDLLPNCKHKRALC